MGFESLDARNLKQMRKGFNTGRGGYAPALDKLRAHDLRLYATFIFGYDEDDPESCARTVAFAKDSGFYIAAFNHLTPFPGTPLYERLAREGRLLYDAWWLDPRYRFNQVAFRPRRMTPAELQTICLEARAEFYSLTSIARRFAHRPNRANWFMARNYPMLNLMLRHEVHQRDQLPLGDRGWTGELIPVDGAV